jgi:glycerophosphoryl diester phosphodiesterase
MPLVPVIYAHRGGAALRPENTIEAFDHGLACGADGLEFDVHLSSDGVVVIHHDDTLERTTSGHGPIAARTAAELARLDAGFHFRDRSGSFPFRDRGIGVPTLPDVLRRYPSALLIIELKVGGERLARRVADEVRAAGAVDRVAIGSFFPDALRAVRAYEPAIATGAAKEETRWALYRSWLGLGIGRAPFREFQVPERSGRTTIVTRRFVAAAHRAGLRVKVWTVNGEGDMRRLIGFGVDGLITDRPDLASALAGTDQGGETPGSLSRARRW